jgi:hypothetical protein
MPHFFGFCHTAYVCEGECDVCNALWCHGALIAHKVRHPPLCDCLGRCFTQ